MKRKLSLLVVTLMLAVTLLAACGSSSAPAPTPAPAPSPAPGSSEPAPTPEPAPAPAPGEMQYLKIEDLKADIDAAANGYVVVDVRKLEDYNKGHIKGSYTADLDAAKNGDDQSGITNLKAALNEAVGSETGTPDSKYVLVCYSGKTYAQKGTDLLLEMGVAGSNIYTLEGGMKAWEGAGADFKSLVE